MTSIAITIKPTSSEFMTPIASEHLRVCQPQRTHTQLLKSSFSLVFSEAADGHGEGHESESDSEGNDFVLEDDNSEDEDEEEPEYS
jgi:hypothetical protein